MREILADYQRERRAFAELCQPSASQNILFFEAEGGYGKTALLRECSRCIPADLMQIPFDCKTAITIPEIFSRTVNKLGWEGLSGFRERVLSLSRDVSVNIHDVKQKGDQNRIEIALSAESKEDRESRQTILTEAWFRDVRNLRNRLLIMVDTFEKANNEVAQWISGFFLPRVPETPQLRVLIAGRQTPEKHNIEWGDCCQHHRLSGIIEAREWMPVVEAMERCINAKEPLEYLAGICYALRGRPLDIIEAIKSLPYKKEAA